MDTPICPVMSKLVPYGHHNPGTNWLPADYRLRTQPCIGSKCAAWRPGVSSGQGTCGLANDPEAFEDPAHSGPSTEEDDQEPPKRVPFWPLDLHWPIRLRGENKE